MPTVVPERAAGPTGQGPGAVRPGHSPVLPRGTGRTAARIGALTVCQAALMVGFGLLITGPARHVWPLTVEDDVDEGFERIRTGPLNDPVVSRLGGRQHPHGDRRHPAELRGPAAPAPAADVASGGLPRRRRLAPVAGVPGRHRVGGPYPPGRGPPRRLPAHVQLHLRPHRRGDRALRRTRGARAVPGPQAVAVAAGRAAVPRAAGRRRRPPLPGHAPSHGRDRRNGQRRPVPADRRPCPVHRRVRDRRPLAADRARRRDRRGPGARARQHRRDLQPHGDRRSGPREAAAGPRTTRPPRTGVHRDHRRRPRQRSGGRCDP